MSALTQNIVSRLRLNPDSPFAKGLVGCWLMGNRACWRSNKLLDLSPYRNHGILTNMSSLDDWVHDGERAGLDFDGVDDYVLASSNMRNSPFSVAFWYFRKTNSSTDTVFHYGNEAGTRQSLHLRMYASSTFRFGLYSDDLNVSLTAGLNVWSFIVCVLDSNYKQYVYEDGSLLGSRTAGGFLSNTVDTAYIGTLLRASEVADVKISSMLNYNRALSSAEVSQLYEETRDGSYGSLVLTDEGRRQTTTVFIPKVPDKPIMRDVVAQRVKTSDYLELNTDSPLSRGLVGCWLMGAAQHWGSAKLLDLSPYGNHGTLQNMDPQTDWVHDGTRAGLDFDGVDDYVDLPQHVDLAAGSKLSFSRILWCRTAGSGNVDRLWKYASASGTDGLEIRREAWSTIISVARYVNWTTKTLKGPAINDDKWHLVAYTETNSETFTLFVDGVVVDQVTSTATPGTSSLSYDRLGDSGGVGWLGPIGAAIHVNRALSPAEVLQFYHETKNGSYGSLVRRRRIYHISEEPKYASSIRTSVPTIITSSKTRDNTARSLKLNPDSPFAKGLVGCWLAGNPACKRSGKLLDLSPYRNHGTLTNMDPQTDWVHNGKRAGLDFDGVNDSCRISDSQSLRLPNSLTISLWVYIRSYAAAGTMEAYVSKGSNGETSGLNHNYLFGMDKRFATSTNTITLLIEDSLGNNYLGYYDITGATTPLNNWYHLVGTWDGNIIKVWHNADDSLTTTGVFTGPADTGSPDVMLGQATFDTIPGWSEMTDAILDDVRIYNRALSANEVKQLYYETRDGSYGSLVL